MQDLLNTRRKNFFFNFFSYRISYLYFFQLTFQSVYTILQFKHLTHQRPNLPRLNGHQSFARLGRQRPRRTSDFRSGHDIRIRLPARDITFDTLATDNRRTQSSRRENRTRSLAIQISAHAADLKITRIRNPVRCNRLNRRQRTKILDLRIAKLPFRHIDPIHPTKRNTFSTLADYLRKRTYQNGIYYHLTRDGMGVCDTRIALR
jgi:hypothetical protein